MKPSPGWATRVKWFHHMGNPLRDGPTQTHDSSTWEIPSVSLLLPPVTVSQAWWAAVMMVGFFSDRVRCCGLLAPSPVKDSRSYFIRIPSRPLISAFWESWSLKLKKGDPVFPVSVKVQTHLTNTPLNVLTNIWHLGDTNHSHFF